MQSRVIKGSLLLFYEGIRPFRGDWRILISSTLDGIMKKNTIDDFWAKVEKTSDCWLFQGSTAQKGYGSFRFHGKVYRAHRWIYEQTHGLIPEGMEVKHSCDVRNCVRPEHLTLGSHQQNMAEMAERKRSARGEKVNTSKLTEEEVRAIRFLRNAHDYTMKQLATHFKVDSSTICDIVNRKIWRHI